MSKAKVVSAKELAAFKTAEAKANAAVQSLYAQEEAVVVEKTALARVTRDQQIAAEEVARLEAALKTAKTAKDKAAEKRLAPELDTAKTILKAKGKLAETTAKSLAKSEKEKEALSKEADKAIAAAKKAGVTAQMQYNPAVKAAVAGTGVNSERSSSEAGAASSTSSASSIESNADQLTPAQSKFATIITNALDAELKYLRMATTKPVDLPANLIETVAKGVNLASGLLSLVPAVGSAASVLSNICLVAIGLNQERRKAMAVRVVTAMNSVDADDYKAIAKAFARNMAMAQAHLLAKLSDKGIDEHAAQVVESTIYALMHEEHPVIGEDAFLAAALSGRSGAGVTSTRNTELDCKEKGEPITSQGALVRAGLVTKEPSGTLVFFEPTDKGNVARYGYNVVPFAVAKRLIDAGKYKNAEPNKIAVLAQSAELARAPNLKWQSATIGECQPITQADLDAHSALFLSNHQAFETKLADLAGRMELNEEQMARVKELVGDLDKRVTHVEGAVGRLDLQVNNYGEQTRIWNDARKYCVYGLYESLGALLQANPWLATTITKEFGTHLAYDCCDGASEAINKAKLKGNNKHLFTPEGRMNHIAGQAKCLELLLNVAEGRTVATNSLAALGGERVPLVMFAAGGGAVPCLELLVDAGADLSVTTKDGKGIYNYARGRLVLDYLDQKLAGDNSSSQTTPSPKGFQLVSFENTVGPNWLAQRSA